MRIDKINKIKYIIFSYLNIKKEVIIMMKTENKKVNYMLEIIKKNRNVFEKEYIKDVLILYCNAEIANRKGGYKDSFIYSLNSKGNKSYEIKKDDWEKISGGYSIFIFLQNSEYKKKELIALSSKKIDDGDLVELTDANSGESFFYYEKTQILLDSRGNEFNDVLRIMKSFKDEVDNFFKEKYVYVYKNYILRCIDKSIHIDHISKTVLSYLDTGEESKKSQNYTDENMSERVQKRRGMYINSYINSYINPFINDLLSDSERRRKEAEEVLERITKKIDNKFYRMIFFMLKNKEPENFKKHPTKEKGFCGIFKKKRVKSIPTIFKKKYREYLLMGIALLLFYEYNTLYNYFTTTVSERAHYIDEHKKVKEELIELVSALANWMNENLHKSYLKVYVDIIENLQKLIFTELDIKYRIDNPEVFTGIRELKTGTYHFDKEYASLCGYQESVDITKELNKIKNIFKNIDSILESVEYYNSEYDKLCWEKEQAEQEEIKKILKEESDYYIE